MNEAKQYLLDAIDILKVNMTPLFPLAGIGLLLYLPVSPTGTSGFVLFLPVILLFFIYPLIYGKYSEIIQKNGGISYAQIFQKHWLNFFVVSLLAWSPVVLVTFIGMSLRQDVLVVRILMSLTVDVLTIYIIPLVFLLNERLSSITLGFKCLLGNFNFSIPLVLLTLLPSLFVIILRNPLGNSGGTAAGLFLNYLFWLLGIFFDFVIFIAATLILKDKLLDIDPKEIQPVSR